MISRQSLKMISFSVLVATGLIACGGGGGGGNDDPMTPPPIPEPLSADFGKTVSGLVAPNGSVTLSDGSFYDENTVEIDVPGVDWQFSYADDSESTDLDDVFSD